MNPKDKTIRKNKTKFILHGKQTLSKNKEIIQYAKLKSVMQKKIREKRDGKQIV